MATISNTDTHDLNVFQGKTYVEQFTCQVLTDPTLPYNAITNPWIPLDLTNYDIRMQVRASYDASVIKLTALSTGVSPKFSKTSNVATLTLLPADTTAINFTGEDASYVYDIELVHQTYGTVLMLAYGAFNLKREVTR